MDLRAFFNSEVKPTMGCTEPGALAYAAAVAAERLQGSVSSIHIAMSMAIYKNGRSVGIPGTHGLRGLTLAATLGALGGDASKGLLALDGISEVVVASSQALIAAGKVTENVLPDTPPMWATITLTSAEHTVACTVAQQHDHVEKIVVDGETVLYDPLEKQAAASWPEELMRMDFIQLWSLALNIDADTERQMLEGAAMNMSILDNDPEALGGFMGGAFPQYAREASVADKIKRTAGAASDLRMSGGDVRVMSSAGSGNHGIVAIIPVAMTARTLGASDTSLAKALALSHLVCGYIKAYTGRLTPTCGCAVAAGAGAAAAIVYLHGGSVRQAEMASITLVGTLLGMICDGAKESCGLKVSSAASEAWNAALLALDNKGIQSNQGIISPDIHELGKTLREFNEKIMGAADSVMIGIMEKQDH